ncbi:MAG: helix-turn-helix transcriptional regulator [Alphaproteobacteria bacterium]|nr:helix-turn-helix transcriptional regulator [Alphaproteobacteria bacterium]
MLPTLPHDVSLLLTAAVLGTPSRVETLGTPVRPLPPPEEWLLAAFQRSVRLEDGRGVSILHQDGSVLGVVVAGGEIPDLPLQRQPRVGIVHEPSRVVLDARGTILGATDPRALDDPDLLQALRARLGRRFHWIGLAVRWTPLLGAMEGGWIADLLPSCPLPLPSFAGLTPSQMEVVELASSGLSSRELASIRGCTEETVRSHLKAVYRRTGFASRVELVGVVHEWDAWRNLFAA